MVKFVRFVLLVTFVLSLSSAVLATSTIDPTQPLQGQPYQSGPIRNNFQSAANDINALQTCNFGAQAPPAPQSGYCWVNTTAAPTWTYNFYDALTSKWVPVFNFDSVNSLLEPPIGGGLPGTLLSAATTDLCSLPQSTLFVSGTTTITAFGATCPAGTVKLLTFNGALTLQYNASSLILPGAANITTAAGDSMLATALGSGNWKVLFYQSATTSPNLAPLNSPNFTGIPTAPTAPAGTNTTQLATTAFVANATPLKLTGPQTLNVATTGSDSGNNCTSASAPCLTIQQACSQAQSNYDLNGNVLTIQIANGTYTAGCQIASAVRGQVNYTGLVIQGNIGAPDNVILNCATSCFQASNGAAFTIQGFKLTSASSAIASITSSVIGVGNNDFSTATGLAHLFANNFGIIVLFGNYTISGNAGAHWSQNAGEIFVPAGTTITVTCVGAPAFSTAFASSAYPGVISTSSTQVSFSACGSVTGSRYSAQLNGVIFTNGAGATFYPGNAAGTTATGGQYD